MQRDYLGYILAVISIIVGIYVSWFYYGKSLQHRRPIFAGDYLPSTVFDVKQEIQIPLKVTRENGEPLKKSVHVATHIFWNSGNMPITTSDVLTPIQVSLNSPDAELISVSVTRQSRNVVGCSVKQGAGNSFLISFRILEQDDGCQIRVFYAGPQSPKYKVDGEIVGVKKIEASGETVFDLIERQKNKTDLLENILNYVPRTILWAAIITFSWLYLRSGPLSRKRIVIIGGCLGLLALTILFVDRIQSSLRTIDSPPSANTTAWVKAIGA